MWVNVPLEESKITGILTRGCELERWDVVIEEWETHNHDLQGDLVNRTDPGGEWLKLGDGWKFGSKELKADGTGWVTSLK